MTVGLGSNASAFPIRTKIGDSRVVSRSAVGLRRSLHVTHNGLTTSAQLSIAKVPDIEAFNLCLATWRRLEIDYRCGWRRYARERSDRRLRNPVRPRRRSRRVPSCFDRNTAAARDDACEIEGAGMRRVTRRFGKT